MAVPVLKLNLAPPSNFWRLNHGLLGWAAIALGGLVLAGTLGLTWKAYDEAARSGKLAGNLTAKTRSTADAQARVLAELRSVDVAKELPRWRLAERIYTERSLPWSRLTAELERSMVEGVRVSSLQRNRGSDLKVQLKLKGEARTREAEAAFVESLQKNPFFEQVILEQEGERQGGGVLFNYSLAVSSTPPPYKDLPHMAQAAKPAAGRAPVFQPSRIAVPPPMPSRVAPPPARSPFPANPGNAPSGRPGYQPLPSSLPAPGYTDSPGSYRPPQRPAPFRGGARPMSMPPPGSSPDNQGSQP